MPPYCKECLHHHVGKCERIKRYRLSPISMIGVNMNENGQLVYWDDIKRFIPKSMGGEKE